MSPLSGQSTLFLRSRLTEEFHSESLWTDDSTSSAFLEGTFHFFGGTSTALDDTPAFPTVNLLPLFEDDPFGPPSVPSEDLEGINCVGVLNGYNVPFSIQPADLFGSAYQTTYTEPYHEYKTCLSAEATGIHGILQPMPVQPDISAIAQTLSTTHLVPGLINPSTTVAYPQFLAPQVPPSPSSESNLSIPTSPTSVSLRSYDSSESDGDTDYLPPSDDEHKLTSSPRLNKRKTTYKSTPLRRATFSPARSTSSESEKSTSSSRSARRSHPYRRHTPSRNFQCEDSTSFTKGKLSSRCPVVGCDYVQKNRRVPDLKRHIETHDRWREPEKWVCCGVGMDRAHLYDKRIKQGMSDDERIEAGAYEFRGRLMIGGCMKTFSRRDALKRHLDNRKIPCIGYMRSYCF